MLSSSERKIFAMILKKQFLFRIFHVDSKVCSGQLLRVNNHVPALIHKKNVTRHMIEDIINIIDNINLIYTTLVDIFFQRIFFKPTILINCIIDMVYCEEKKVSQQTHAPLHCPLLTYRFIA